MRISLRGHIFVFSFSINPFFWRIWLRKLCEYGGGSVKQGNEWIN
jgi:hypothetical protein